MHMAAECARAVDIDAGTLLPTWTTPYRCSMHLYGVLDWSLHNADSVLPVGPVVVLAALKDGVVCMGDVAYPRTQAKDIGQPALSDRRLQI
jgi:hypothetical protein